jgi:hypothetical protein
MINPTQLTSDDLAARELKSLTIAATRACLTALKDNAGKHPEIALKISEALRNLLACEPLAEIVKNAVSQG